MVAPSTVRYEKQFLMGASKYTFVQNVWNNCKIKSIYNFMFWMVNSRVNITWYDIFK